MGHDRSSYQAAGTICMAFGEQIEAKDNCQRSSYKQRTHAFRKDNLEPPEELLREHGGRLRAFKIVGT